MKTNIILLAVVLLGFNNLSKADRFYDRACAVGEHQVGNKCDTRDKDGVPQCNCQPDDFSKVDICSVANMAILKSDPKNLKDSRADLHFEMGNPNSSFTFHDSKATITTPIIYKNQVNVTFASYGAALEIEQKIQYLRAAQCYLTGDQVQIFSRTQCADYEDTNPTFYAACLSQTLSKNAIKWHAELVNGPSRVLLKINTETVKYDSDFYDSHADISATGLEFPASKALRFW